MMMMPARTAWASWSLALLFWLGNGVAQAEPTQEVFVRHLMQRVSAGDGRGILLQSKASPAQAQAAFVYFLKGYDEYTEARPLRARILNMLARGLALQGDTACTQVLRERQLLEPSLAEWTLETAPSVAVEQQLAAADLNEWARRSQNYLAEAGAYRQLASVLMALPKSEENRRRAWACRVLAGEYQLARSSEPSDALGCSIELHAGWLGGMPDLVEKWLPRLEQALPQATPQEEPWFRFLQLSWRTRRELEQRPNMPLEELLRRHEAAWKLLDTARVPPAGSLIPGLFTPAASFWETALERRWNGALVSENQGLMSAFSRENECLNRLVKAEFEDHRDAMSLVSTLCLLDRHEASLERGWAWNPQTFAKLLSLLDTLVGEGLATCAERDQDLQATLPDSVAAALPAGFQVHLAESNWSLLGERMQRARLHQRMSEENEPDAAELVAIAEQGLKYQAAALRGLGYQGMKDLRWTYVKMLIAWTPENWEKELEARVDELLGLNTALNYLPGKAMALAYQASQHSRHGDRAGAIQRFQDAVAAYETYAQEVGLEGVPELRRDFSVIYDRLSELLIESGQTSRAWLVLQRQLQLQGLFEHQEGLAARPQLAKVRELQRRSAALQQQVLTVTATGGNILALTRGEFRSLLRNLHKTQPRLAEALSLQPVSLELLQAKLPEDTTLVQYFPRTQRLYIFVVTRRKIRIQSVNVTSAHLRAAVERARQLLLGGALAGDRKPSPALRQQLRQLDEWLLEPIRPDLSKTQLLAVRPSHSLHYVPFAALLGKDGKYQVERQATVDLVKGADLTLLTRAPRKRPRSLFALGNPDGSLPGAAQEVQEISTLFPASRPAVGDAATSSRLRAMAPSTGYVHLATHGVLMPQDPRQSYLVLADSHLYTADIYALNLSKVGLVTLSACNTAVQEDNPGAEVHSLAEAFSVAGGQSVLASLWSVSDEATRLLMANFYREVLGGRTLGEGLRQAQLSTLRQPQFAHPFYWGAFTLLGDWR
ncbi:MAG: CHAT domain-containing protein [Vulcanimicrobiota bacterium]